MPGQRLIELDITRELNSSRSKVREALRRLESEGLVSIEEFRGASVKRIGIDEIRRIYRARMALEGIAAHECALADNPKIRRRLRDLQERMNALEENFESPTEFGQLNREWHDTIIEGADNSYVARFLTQLTVPIYSLLFSSLYNLAHIRRANADHRLITAAICEGRATDAEQAMRDHVANGLKSLMTIHERFGA